MARYFIRFADTAGGAQSPAALFRREMRDSIPSDATIGPGGWQLTDELPSLLRAARSASTSTSSPSSHLICQKSQLPSAGRPAPT
jgi:hypothetical protein